MKFLPGAVVEVSCGGKIMLSLSYCDADAVVAVGKGSDIIVFLCGGDGGERFILPAFFDLWLSQSDPSRSVSFEERTKLVEVVISSLI
jgi:hypothetical protein